MKNRSDAQAAENSATAREAVGSLVVLATAEAAVRQWWVDAIGDTFAIEKVDDPTALRKTLTSLRPSILVLDLGLPRLGRTKGLAALVQFSPSTKVIALAEKPDDREAVAALRAGAHGYCGREIEVPLVRKLLDAVQKGELWAKRSVMLALLRELLPVTKGSSREASSSTLDSRLQPLTAREREIAYLVSAGAKNKDIAASLNITETTVKAHLTAIFRKLGIPDRLRLALMITEGDQQEPRRSGRSRS